ncbi:MAG: spore coat protein U domain-containing protein [Rhodanobacter sp.]
MHLTLLRCCASLLLLGFSLFWIGPAHAAAVACTASMTNVAFGNVSPQSSQTNSNATLSYSCTNTSAGTAYATVCFSIGEPANGPTNPRRMKDPGGDTLNFQLYQDASRSVIWGSQTVAPLTPLLLNMSIPKGGIQGSATLYGQVLAGQNTAIPSSYSDVYTAANTGITVNVGAGAPPGTCTNLLGNNTSFPFTVTATVVPQCTVSAGTLDFGTIGLLTSAVPGTSTLGVQCSNGTPYKVGLDAGQNGSGNINARKMVLAANSIGYQLYQDPGRTLVWGNTFGGGIASSNIVAGTGNTQNLTVYGLVPSQITPVAGTYNDTIMVTVQY